VLKWLKRIKELYNLESLVTRLLVKDPEFLQRTASYRELIADFRRKLSEQSVRESHLLERHLSRGRLPVRERIDRLLDVGTPFLEWSVFAAYGKYHGQFPNAGIVTGVGYIHGREVVVIANDSLVKGGTYVAETIKKHLRAQEIAMQNNLPCIYLVDSGGIFLREQSKVFADRDDFGRIFFNMARMSAQGIPQIAIVMGSCTAGGAYIPAMSDETVIIREQGTIFLGGPPLVQAATGEKISAEELGGGEVHTSVSGVADHLARDEEHALQLGRSIVATLPKPEKQVLNTEVPADPLYPIEELYGILGQSPREAVDAYEVIARLVDRSEWHEFKKKYAQTLLTGFAHIMGYPVGIIANNGILYSESALKATHFIELCNFRKIPLLFLQNVSGFMVGKKYEHGGIARDGAKMVHAVANAVVPRFTLVYGGSYGAGNYAMSGRAFDPNFMFMYPNARVAVMGGEQAATVLAVVKQEQLQKEGKELTNQEMNNLKEPVLKKYELESSAYFASSELWDDGIIDPADTRKVLAMAIETSLNKTIPEPRAGIYRM